MPPRRAAVAAAIPGSSDTTAVSSTQPAGVRKSGNAAADLLANYPAIKPRDGDPIMRHDLQWDALSLIFSNISYRFTPPSYPHPSTPLFPTDRTWSFAELYLDCISNSSRANKSLKDKMSESTDFAVNFGKLCLLINVGRINTTLAFYPEMRTALRTYHPVPAMQLDEFTRKNLQDAPRMKAQLKGCANPQEVDKLPDSLYEIVHRGHDLGIRPPTCIVQLIFQLYIEHGKVQDKYFPAGITMHDLFFPGAPSDTLPSIQRAETFLWLVYRFLETPALVAADFASGLEKLPSEQLRHLTRMDCSAENVDSEMEREFAREMRVFRDAFVDKIRTDEIAAQTQAALAAASAARGALSGNPGEEVTPGVASLALSQSVGSSGTARAVPAPLSATSLLEPPSSNAGTPRSTARPTLAGGPLSSPAKANPRGKRARSTASQDHGGASTPGPPSEYAPGSARASPALVPMPAMVSTTAVIAMSPAPAEIGQRRRAKREPLAGARPLLVPYGTDAADLEVTTSWTTFCQAGIAKGTERSLLKTAWKRVKRDVDAKRNPVYDSEDELDWSPLELEARTRGFAFRNHRNGGMDTLRYEGAAPVLALVPDLPPSPSPSPILTATDGQAPLQPGRSSYSPDYLQTYDQRDVSMLDSGEDEEIDELQED